MAKGIKICDKNVNALLTANLCKWKPGFVYFHRVAVLNDNNILMYILGDCMKYNLVSLV